MSPSPNLPRLDCHAHIAPDVTGSQIAALDGAIIFAVTRTPSEAVTATRRSDETIIWGYGAHPGVTTAAAQVTTEGVRRAIDETVLIGEIGLDRKTALGPQRAAFETILEVCSGQPVLLSIHSTGRTREVLTALSIRPHPGAVLHWFNGSTQEIRDAVELGCYFSVNGAMTHERISSIPTDRLLPETDFPSSRRSTRARRPGDIDYLEGRIAALTGEPTTRIRTLWYRNLGRLVRAAGVEARLPERVVALLHAV